jgi:hypothetical protein
VKSNVWNVGYSFIGRNIIDKNSLQERRSGSLEVVDGFTLASKDKPHETATNQMTRKPSLIARSSPPLIDNFQLVVRQVFL